MKNNIKEEWILILSKRSENSPIFLFCPLWKPDNHLPKPETQEGEQAFFLKTLMLGASELNFV